MVHLVGHSPSQPFIKHEARNVVVRLYGANGPDTAFKKVAAAFTAETGIKVEVTGGPEPTWSKKAQANADILWGTAEKDVTALLETYTMFDWADVTPIHLRTATAVRENAGVANTSGTGTWEDVAGRTGSLGDVKRLRRNIIGFGKGSGPSFQMFVAKDADVRRTWPDWPITRLDVAEIVGLSVQRRICETSTSCWLERPTRRQSASSSTSPVTVARR